MKLQRIVLATDLSRQSQPALETALSLARDSGAELHLFFVIERAGNDGNELFPAVDVVEAGYKQSRLKLEGLVPDDEATRLHIRTACSTGIPSTEIAHYARHVDADLIVVGTHGRRGVRRILMGSTAEKLLRRSPCAILVVKGLPEEAG